jgi:NAD(P)-dependent dehydrogenase (short-subunit alcohol dehydrogenase family)
MGADLQGEHPCDVLPDQGGSAAYEAWQRHHQYCLDQRDAPNPTLLAYATTKGAIQNFTAGLAQFLADKGIRANAVAPGPIWTPLIPSTMPEEAVEDFGKQVPMKRPGQPAELATAYVMLADPLSSYVSGATIAVTGGKPII